MSTSVTPRNRTNSCLVSLVQINRQWLRQGFALLAEIDDNVYSTTPPGFPQYRVGAHVRHVLDFYQCFFKGLQGRQIDYDVRSRDRNIEISRSAASIAIRNSIHA